MAKVKMTVQTLKDRGLWDDVCEQKGWSPWILNEGRIDYDDWVEFDDEFPPKEQKYQYQVKDGLRSLNISSKTYISKDEIIDIEGEIYQIYNIQYPEHLAILWATKIKPLKVERIDNNE